VPARLRGDPGRLRQCLVTCSATRPSSPRAALSPSRPSSSRWPVRRRELRFTVGDTGIGIARPDRLDRLFQQFSQVDASTTRHFGGSASGLDRQRTRRR